MKKTTKSTNVRGLHFVLFLAVSGLYFLPLKTHAQVFNISADESVIKILVYRQGILSVFGHDHVIVSKNVTGTVTVDENHIDESRAQLKIPVNTLIVDDPIYRQEEGGGFTKKISPQDAQDTRNEMLSKNVLDGKRYPDIEIRTKSISGQLPNLTVKADFMLHGVTKEFNLPVTAELNKQQLLANGKFVISQKNFGITPLNILLGTISVKDDVLIKYKISAKIPESKVDGDKTGTK